MYNASLLGFKTESLGENTDNDIVIENGIIYKLVDERIDNTGKLQLKHAEVIENHSSTGYNVISDSVKDYIVTAICPNAFANNNAITGIAISDTVSIIGKNAFQGCHNLETVSYPKSLEIIDSYAFADCYELINASFPDNLKSIGDGAFDYCMLLIDVNIPNNISSIGYDSFVGCLPNTFSVSNKNRNFLYMTMLYIIKMWTQLSLLVWLMPV